jgi:hypothetical protein
MNQAEIFRSERAKGASLGASIMGGFGAAWLAMGMTSAGAPFKIALAVVLPVFALIVWLGWTVRHRLPKFAGPESPEKKQTMRIFAVVNIVQWFAIFGVINLLHKFHLCAWIVPAIVLIVGAHFLPLARIFHAPQHRTTGIAMMAVAALAIVLPASLRDTVECLSAGLILWISTAGALYAAFRMAPQSTLAPLSGL